MSRYTFSLAVLALRSEPTRHQQQDRAWIRSGSGRSAPHRHACLPRELKKGLLLLQCVQKQKYTAPLLPTVQDTSLIDRWRDRAPLLAHGDRGGRRSSAAVLRLSIFAPRRQSIRPPGSCGRAFDAPHAGCGTVRARPRSSRAAELARHRRRLCQCGVVRIGCGEIPDHIEMRRIWCAQARRERG